MNSALRTLTSGQMPAMTGMLAVLDAAQKASSSVRSNTGCVTAHSAPASTLYSKRRISSSIFGTPGLAPTPMTNDVPAPMRVAADVQPPVEVVHDVDQTDRVHVKNRRGVGIVAHLGRIAGDADQIVNAESQPRPAGPTACSARCGRGRCSAGSPRSPLPAAPAGTRPGCSCAPKPAGCREY